MCTHLGITHSNLTGRGLVFATLHFSDFTGRCRHKIRNLEFIIFSVFLSACTNACFRESPYVVYVACLCHQTAFGLPVHVVKRIVVRVQDLPITGLFWQTFCEKNYSSQAASLRYEGFCSPLCLPIAVSNIWSKPCAKT